MIPMEAMSSTARPNPSGLTAHLPAAVDVARGPTRELTRGTDVAEESFDSENVLANLPLRIPSP
jgi:hypothetical protein